MTDKRNREENEPSDVSSSCERSARRMSLEDIAFPSTEEVRMQERRILDTNKLIAVLLEAEKATVTAPSFQALQREFVTIVRMEANFLDLTQRDFLPPHKPLSQLLAESRLVRDCALLTNQDKSLIAALFGRYRYNRSTAIDNHVLVTFCLQRYSITDAHFFEQILEALLAGGLAVDEPAIADDEGILQSLIGLSPLLIACSQNLNRTPPSNAKHILATLIRHGANPTAVDEDGDTLVHWLVWFAATQVLEHLLKLFPCHVLCDFTRENYRKKTILDMASEKGSDANRMYSLLRQLERKWLDNWATYIKPAVAVVLSYDNGSGEKSLVNLVEQYVCGGGPPFPVAERPPRTMNDALRLCAPQARGECILCGRFVANQKNMPLYCVCSQRCLDNLPEKCARQGCNADIGYFSGLYHGSPLWHCCEYCMAKDVAELGPQKEQRWSDLRAETLVIAAL